MRDEHKTMEQLITELQKLRQRLNGGVEVPKDPASRGDVAATCQTSESYELEWDPKDSNFPTLDQTAGMEESPRFLIAPHGRAIGEEYPGGNVTETGSFDMRWISLASFGRLLHAIPIPILLTDVSGNTQFANNAFLKLSGHASFTADSFYSMFPNGEEQRIRTLVESTLVQRQPQSREGTLLLKDREIWSRLNLRSIRFGTDRSILVLIEDLTLEKRELTLNAKYKSLVDIFPIGIAEFAFANQISPQSCDDELLAAVASARMTDGNIQFAKLHGHESLTELKTMTFREILGLPAHEDYCRKWVRTGFSMTPFETREIGPGGECRYFENTLVGNVRDGWINQFWVMKQDITERKRVQEELVEKLRTIDELYEHIVQSGKAKAIAEHTAKVAHELRQPLAIIGGFSRRMARESATSEKHPDHTKNEGFEIIINEVQRLEKILGRLVDFSRHETVTLQRVNPKEVIHYVLRINEGRLKEKNLRAELSLGEEIGDIFVDADRFQQVIRNLVANAIEASPPHTAIRIETGVSIPSEKAHKAAELTAESYFQMKIQNQGKTIPPEDLKKIFDPFFTTKSYGTGLGLTLSKKIVEDHSGSISVRSDAEGTVFTVWLPINQPIQGQQAQ